MYETLGVVATAILYTGLRGAAANVLAPVAIVAIFAYKVLQTLMGV